jgi:hypothetical protein
MRSLVYIALFVAATSAALAVDTVVDYLRARSTGASVILEWRSTTETDVVRYEVERAGQDGIFRYVATVDAKGSNQTYEYADDEAFSKPDNAKVAANYFTYRLRMMHADKSADYSVTAGVSHSVSSIKRTWGMIKEMFR